MEKEVEVRAGNYIPINVNENKVTCSFLRYETGQGGLWLIRREEITKGRKKKRGEKKIIISVIMKKVVVLLKKD